MYKQIQGTGYVVWVLGIVFLMVTWGCSDRSTTQKTEESAQEIKWEDMQEGELKDHMQELEEKLDEMKRGEGAPPAYKEYLKVQKQLWALQQSNWEEEHKLRESRNNFNENKEIKEWNDKIADLMFQLIVLREKCQKEIKGRGAALNMKRREELASISIADTPKLRTMDIPVLECPCIDGSTSTQPLGMIILCKIFDSPYLWGDRGQHGEGWYSKNLEFDLSDYAPYSMAPINAGLEYYRNKLYLNGYMPKSVPSHIKQHKDVWRSLIINHILNVHTGTHGAYENVIRGFADIGLVAREPSTDELEFAEENDVQLDVVPIALDAFVFIKNKKNPLKVLSTQQIQSIYSGRVKNWSDIGGPHEAINAYRRNRNSGSQELMENLVMKGISFEALDFPDLHSLELNMMASPYIKLTRDTWGIGYSVYYYEHFMVGSPDTELLAVDGVLPSYDTIQSREYPYVTKVYAIIRKDENQDTNIVKLRDWLLSAEGQGVIRESGYVPLNP